jgi:hypothetical protein
MSARVAAATVIVSALLAVGGCSISGNPRSAPNPAPQGTGSASGSAAASATPATATAASTQAKTPEGWPIKGVGERVGYGGTGLEDALVTFAVDRIEVNPECARYGIPAHEGNKTVVLYATMSTGQLNQDEAASAAMIFNPFSFKGVTPDGVVHDAQPGSCLDYAGSFPTLLAPNAKYSGKVEVEVPARATSVASVNSLNSSQGWAWPIG